MDVDALAARSALALADRIVFRLDKFRLRGGRGYGKPIPTGLVVALVADALPPDMAALPREMLARVIVASATFREALR